MKDIFYNPCYFRKENADEKNSQEILKECEESRIKALTNHTNNKSQSHTIVDKIKYLKGCEMNFKEKLIELSKWFEDDYIQKFKNYK